jgi:hypothetical protein
MTDSELASELRQIAAVAREDITKLLKEYARAGYRAVHGQDDEDFEALWGQAFDADCHADPKGR